MIKFAAEGQDFESGSNTSGTTAESSGDADGG
eukprot:SAG31_NODE_10227_length_1168_cov_0.697848_2_plen_31_part_01